MGTRNGSAFERISGGDDMCVTQKFSGGRTGIGSAEMLTVGTAIEARCDGWR